MFNGRHQNSAPYMPCDTLPNRGIYVGQLSVKDKQVKMTPPKMLHLKSSQKVERNWIPLENQKENRMNKFSLQVLETPPLIPLRHFFSNFFFRQ